MPLADAAVRIADALGVTVEYLITGRERQEQKNHSLVPDPQVILKSLESLNIRDRKIVLSVISTLKEIKDAERKALGKTPSIPD